MSKPSRLCIFLPSFSTKVSGNAVTGHRFEQMFRELGYEVRLSGVYEECEGLVALNAYRSSECILRYRKDHPNHPIVVVLTGTDIYRFLQQEPEPTFAAMMAADCLVGFNDLTAEAVPELLRPRVKVILEGAPAASLVRAPTEREVSVAVIGHLRDEKDPLRAALATRHLRSNSRIKIHHFGSAHSKSWADQARAEMARNPRYHWYGEVDRAKLDQIYASSHVLAQTSHIEGGSNVISEAIVAGLPILASRIPGNVGVLGQKYSGYVQVGDTNAWAQALARIEHDPKFVEQLSNEIKELRPRVRIEQERRQWAELLEQLKLSPQRLRRTRSNR